MRNGIYGVIVGLVAGILIGVYGIAPTPVTKSADDGGFARESKVETVVASAERKQSIVIGTGHVRGAYHAAGIGICRFINKRTAEHGVECETRNTQGDVENINGLQRLGGHGDLTMAVAQSRWVNHAHNGYGRFESAGPNRDIRAVFSLHPQPLTVAARADADIRHFKDLEGKRVNIGDPGSLQHDAMEVLMAELGWDASTFAPATAMNPEDSVKALCDNQLDAIVTADGNPDQHLRDASIFCDIVLVEVTGPAVDKLVQDNYYYIATSIPGGTYKGAANDTRTFGAVAMIMAGQVIQHDVIYTAVKSVFENFEEFKGLHSSFAGLTKEDMITRGIQVSMHGGSDKYLREVGLR
jgi:TRAP transporter TAXI family solute receptor